MKSALCFRIFTLLLLPFISKAQIIFVDPDALRVASQAAAVTSPTLQISAAVLRFTPKDSKSETVIGDLSQAGSFPAILSTLGQKGQVDILYFGSRTTRSGTDELAIFNSLEKRSAFWNEKDKLGSTNRQFGFTLGVSGRIFSNDAVHLNWTGNLAWSPQFLNAWAGDKYLMFGMKLAKFVPGMSYTVDEEESDEDSGEGINLRKVFKSKKKKEQEAKEKEAKGAKPPISFSFIEAEGREVDVTGKQFLKSGEFVVLSRLSEAGKKEKECIYLVLQPILLN